MKKMLSLLIIVIMMLSFCGVCYAEETLGNAVYTDVITYINHVPIESHNFNGRTLIAAEDLQGFGFDVKWNEYKRTLTITRNPENNDIYMPFVTEVDPKKIGKKEFTVTTTDVKVYTGDYQYTSFGGITGYTLIDVNELVCIDNVSVVWCPEVRAVKIWVEDGLEMYEKMVKVWPYEDQKMYTWCPYNKDLTLSLECVSVESGCIVYGEVRTKDGTLVICNDDRIDVVDVVDSDGNSIYRRYNPNTSYIDFEAYRMGHTSFLFPRVTMFTNMDIIPTTATDPGGLVVVKYRGCGGDSFHTIRVEQLPVAANE